MTLSRHHRLALVGATALSAMALFDAMVHGFTGHSSVFTDADAPLWAEVTTFAVHGLAYVALAAVLVAERRRVDAVNKAARVARWTTALSLGVLAAVFLALLPVGSQLGAGALAAVEGAAGFAFLGMFLGGFALGVSLWRDPRFHLESRLLSALPVVLVLLVMVVWLAPTFAHPAYLETLLHFGVAVTGAGLLQRAGSRTADPNAALRRGRPDPGRVPSRRRS